MILKINNIYFCLYTAHIHFLMQVLCFLSEVGFEFLHIIYSSLSQRSPDFDHGLVHVIFEVDMVALRQICTGANIYLY